MVSSRAFKRCDISAVTAQRSLCIGTRRLGYIADTAGEYRTIFRARYQGNQRQSIMFSYSHLIALMPFVAFSHSTTAPHSSHRDPATPPNVNTKLPTPSFLDSNQTYFSGNISTLRRSHSHYGASFFLSSKYTQLQNPNQQYLTSTPRTSSKCSSSYPYPACAWSNKRTLQKPSSSDEKWPSS